ncbi:MAG: CRISPR-associated endonuclease Cas1, partial [Acidimicrobiia bacterium]
MGQASMTAQVFGRDPSDPTVCVADGFGIRLFVRHRHLVVSDGVGRHRRERRYARATSRLSRVVVLGRHGYVSLEALRWLADVGAAFVHLDPDGTVLATSVPAGTRNPHLRRAQALAMTGQAGVEIARWLLREKLSGQAQTLALVGRSEKARAEIEWILGHDLERARSIDALLFAEIAAANAYWGAWSDVPVHFRRADIQRLPEHWPIFGQRISPVSRKSPRAAGNPANALLNYLYTLLEAEARLACVSLGLDPVLGILHADKPGRDSLACDVMEAVRPAVDSWVLDLLERRRFRPSDFHETPKGNCRVRPPLSHQLAETLPRWAQAVAPVAERVAQMLAQAPGSRVVRVATPLTQETRRTAQEWKRAHKDPRRELSRIRVPRYRCKDCGKALSNKDRAYCNACLPQFEERQHEVLVEYGQETLARLRAERRDPAHGGDAAQKRGRTQSRQRREEREWEQKHEERPDPELFPATILPLLEAASTDLMARATGLSKSYCRMIKRGEYVPHPRHWATLRT